MARPKRDTVFTEIAGKTVESIKYEENSDWQALELAFSDGTLLTFELSSRVEIQASYLKARKGKPEADPELWLGLRRSCPEEVGAEDERH